MTAPFGLNILAQYVRDRGALMRWLTAAQPAACVVMDDPNLTQQIRATLPNSTIIHRAYNENDRRWWEVTTPHDWLAAHIGLAANGVVLQVLNEPALDDTALTWLEQLCAICPSTVRLALPNFSVGNPHEDDIMAGKYDRLLRLECGTRHILALHEYFRDDPNGEAPYLCGRFTYWLQRAQQLGLPAPRIVITEHGRDHGGGRGDGWRGRNWGEESYYNRLRVAQDTLYRAHNIPVCIYCWGTGANDDWLSFDIQDAPALQQMLIDWNKSHPMKEDTPVPIYPVGTQPQQMRVNQPNGVSLRNAPARSGALLTVLPKDALVTVYAQPVIPADGYFWQRVTAQGQQGWCANFIDGRPSFVAAGTVPAPQPFRLQNPVGCESVITSRFGVPRDYGTHEGLDLAPRHATCTPLILNGHAGVVSFAGNAGAYGKHVKLRSTVGGAEYTVIYAHLDHVFVTAGQTVGAGEPLGIMGSTGNSSGVHLHVSIQKMGAPTLPGSPLTSAIDPFPLIDW